VCSSDLGFVQLNAKCCAYKQRRGTYAVLVGKTEGKSPHGRPGRRC
jgi:hypothetical protein